MYYTTNIFFTVKMYHAWWYVLCSQNISHMYSTFWLCNMNVHNCIYILTAHACVCTCVHMHVCYYMQMLGHTIYAIWGKTNISII